MRVRAVGVVFITVWGEGGEAGIERFFLLLLAVEQKPLHVISQNLALKYMKSRCPDVM